jgi:hypothetical protein
VLISSLASVVAELLAILWFLTKQNLQYITETNAATWQQKVAADTPSLTWVGFLYYSSLLTLNVISLFILNGVP